MVAAGRPSPSDGRTDEQQAPQRVEIVPSAVPRHDALPRHGGDDPVSPGLAVYVWAILALGVGYFLYKRSRSSAAASATPTTGPTVNPSVVGVRDHGGRRSRADSAQTAGRRVEAGRQDRSQTGLKPFSVPAPSAGLPVEPPATIRPVRARHGRRVAIAIFGALLVVAAGTAAVWHARSHATPATTAGAAPVGPTNSVATPARTTVATRPATRTLAWAPAPRAVAYDLELRRGDVVVFTARTRATRIRVRTRNAGKKTGQLTPGTYRWYVWPLRRSGNTRLRGAAIVATTIVVGR
jgi:hypothetical protein